MFRCARTTRWDAVIDGVVAGQWYHLTFTLTETARLLSTRGPLSHTGDENDGETYVSTLVGQLAGRGIERESGSSLTTMATKRSRKVFARGGRIVSRDEPLGSEPRGVHAPGRRVIPDENLERLMTSQWTGVEFELPAAPEHARQRGSTRSSHAHRRHRSKSGFY